MKKIYKIKRFSRLEDKFDNFSKEHPKITLTALGSLAGGVIGGNFFGKKGFLLGSLAGGILGYKGGNAFAREEKLKKDNLSNPKKYLKPILDKNPMDYKKLGLNFPQEFYKFIQINKQFIPIAEKYIIENKILWEPKIIILDPEMIQNEKDGIVDSEKRGLPIFADPEHFDDTWIVWYSETKTFDFDIDVRDGKGSYSSLKKILVQYLSDDISSGEVENNPLDKEYLNFIKRML